MSVASYRFWRFGFATCCLSCWPQGATGFPISLPVPPAHQPVTPPPASGPPYLHPPQIVSFSSHSCLDRATAFNPLRPPLPLFLKAADFCWFPDSHLSVAALSAPVVRLRRTDQSNAASVFCTMQTAGFTTSCPRWATMSPMPHFSVRC